MPVSSVGLTPEQYANLNQIVNSSTANQTAYNSPTNYTSTQDALAQSTQVAQQAAQTPGGSYTQASYSPTGQIMGGYTAPTVINSENTAPTSPIPYVSPTPVATYPTQGLPLTTAAPQTTPLSPEQQSVQNLIEQTQGINNELVGEQAFRSEQETQYGLPELTKTQNDLRAQQQAILNEQTAIQLNAPRSGQGGISTVLINQQQDVKIRENAIRALGISSLLAASQGNLTYAQSLVDKAVEQRFGPKKAQVEANMKNLELILNSPKYTEAIKARAQAQLDIQNAKARDLETQEQNFKEIWNIATTASSNGQNFVATPEYPSLALTLKAISEAPTKEQALQIASSVGLISSPTASTSGGTAPKILGNSTTGYYTYDAATGKTTPISNPNEPVPTPSPSSSIFNPLTGGTIDTSNLSNTTPTTSSYKFTQTQLNSGSAKAGLSIDEFKTLDPDVQNFFVSATSTNLKDIQEAISQVKSGNVKVEEAKAEIDSLSIAPDVKTYFKALIDQAAPVEEESDFKWYNPLTWF